MKCSTSIRQNTSLINCFTTLMIFNTYLTITRFIHFLQILFLLPQRTIRLSSSFPTVYFDYHRCLSTRASCLETILLQYSPVSRHEALNPVFPLPRAHPQLHALSVHSRLRSALVRLPSWGLSHWACPCSALHSPRTAPSPGSW